VLVAGGIYCGGASQIIELSSCELYDPKTGNWSTTGSMSIARDAPTATLLPNGQVLVAGGYDGGYSLSSCELYGPKTGSWSATGSMSAARVENTITLLPSSKVLVAGGGNDIPGYVTSALNSCELYTPSNK